VKNMRALCSFAVLAMGMSVYLATPNPARAQNAAAKSGDDPNFIEIGGYGGFSDYKTMAAGLGAKIDGANILGVRVGANFWNYVGIEGDVGIYSWNKYRFLSAPPTGVPIGEFPIHIVQPSANLLLHFTPRDHKWRPFVTIGTGWAETILGKNGKNEFLAAPPSAGLSNYQADVRFQANYGGGLKYQASPRLGLRIDVRGYVGTVPTFGLPSDPPSTSAYYIPSGKILNGIEATAGLTVYLGHRGEKPAPPPPAPPPPPPPPPPPAAHGLNAGAISASSNSVCPGDAVRLNSNASDPQGHALSYQWSVNNRNQGGNSANYTFTPDAAGDYRIGLHISDTASTDAAGAVDANPISVHVGVYNRPGATGATANPATLDRGQTAALHVNGTGSECSGTLRYSWAATEGTVTGNGPDAQFNSSSVAFNEGDRSRPQSKQVTATATVTDSKGGSATASTTLTINYAAQVRHFGDIVFPKNSARVNNCGKRVLIEQLYPLLTANSNYDVVLVGHIDSSEAPKGKSRRASSLDRDRVLQTAGVLSGGTGTCSSLDASRIRGSWVGATQETESLPTSCSLSTTAPKERRGAAIDDANDAKNRRVEIWLVPKGMSLPAAARDAKDLPAADMKKIGCPK
jgi:outer membrane protein OmpA-like peptidoglycan-associated protein